MLSANQNCEAASPGIYLPQKRPIHTDVNHTAHQLSVENTVTNRSSLYYGTLIKSRL